MTCSLAPTGTEVPLGSVLPLGGFGRAAREEWEKAEEQLQVQTAPGRRDMSGEEKKVLSKVLVGRSGQLLASCSSADAFP